MYRYLNFPAVAVDTANPQQYQISFWYKASNVVEGDVVRVQFRVYQPTSRTWVDYGLVTVGAFPTGETDWTQAQHTVTLDPSLHTDADLQFSQIEVRINTGNYTGEVGFDNFSMQQLGVGTEMLTNPSFTEGYKEVSGGDHAAVYLSRLNGVGFWGSASHHESGGHSFSSNPQETLIYFMRGLPLGDAVWWGENHNSGLFYGDPIYSPVAVRLDYASNDYDYVTGQVVLSGSAVNGRDLTLVDTQFAVDYCPGDDFYVCDRNGSWQSSGLSGTGGQENMSLGTWDTSSIAYGTYTLRLAVTSNNASKGRSQTFYDYYPVTVYNPAGDDDNDGLSNGDEIQVYNTNPSNGDSDGDGLSDGDEVHLYGSNPVSSDSDGDDLPDKWEVDNGLDPVSDDSHSDADGDGLTNLEEFNLQTNPREADTDGDGLTDHEEVNQYQTNPSLPDTDFDQVSDGDEVNVFGTDPLSYADIDFDGMSDDWEFAYGTDSALNDARVDSDGDGVDNVVEYLRGTLPLNAASVPETRIWYVDQANDSGVEYGSPKAPFSTVQAALTASNAGDTISLASGTYELDFFIVSQSVNFVGPADQSAVLVPTYFYAYGPVWGGVENITLQTAYANYAWDVRNYRYRNSRIQAVQGSQLGGGARVTFENCVISGAGQTAITVNGASAVSVINSTIAGNPTGISLASANGGLTLRNSILANTVDLVGVTDGGGISYSLIGDGQFVGVNGNISADPLFMDAANGDYHLQAGSPGIDAGDPADAYANEPEPNGCRVNLGAFGNTTQAAVSSDDPDGDGLYGYCETRAGTDPNHADSDHDGVLDGAEVNAGSSPVNLFDPAGEGMNLAADAGFTLQGGEYLSTDMLHILAWSNLVGSGAGTASYTVSGGGTVLSGTLDNVGDGSYRGSVALGDLNYTGSDVLVEIRLQQKKVKYQAQRTISVSGDGDGNAVPAVAIGAPADGSSHDSGANIAFVGSATDAEDGDLTASLVWTSSLDGAIGAGGSFNAVLSDGVHSITASVTDSGGRVANQVVSVTVGAAAEPIILTASGYKVKGLQAVDLAWSGAAGSQVDVYRNGALIATVANNGAWTDNIGIKGSATYLYSVCEAGTSNCSAEVSVVF
jgi:hypothetical protein